MLECMSTKLSKYVALIKMSITLKHISVRDGTTQGRTVTCFNTTVKDDRPGFN